TIEAMERSGQELIRASRIFFNLTSSNTNDSLQADKAVLAPKLAAHDDAITMDPKLFARIKALYDQRATLGLDSPSTRLIERYYTRFVRSGALLNEAGKEQLRKLNEEESNLTTKFSNDLLKEANASAVVVERKEELDGLDEGEVAVAAEAAQAKGMAGKWLITLQNTTTQPVLASLKDRALRERIYKASIARGARGNATDSRSTVARLAQLRAQKAKLLGFPNYATYSLDDQMARTPEAAVKLLSDMAPAAAANAKAEAAKLQALIDKQKGGFQLAPWDWDFYAEQVRKAEYDLDEAAMKPYFELERVLQDGVFYAAKELYGITFKERTDIPVYHPDVRVFEVIDADGSPIGLFYGDYYKRDSKQGGAWMDGFQEQCGLLGLQPVVTQNMNVPKPVAGQPTLLSFDNVTTLFHEFGHALHGLLSQVRYPYFSGTNVPRDFVEFPSQFNENWALEPRVLAHYAKHYKTGAPMPQALVQKIRNSQTFNQGFMTTEYLAAALLDLQWHMLPADAPLQDPEAFEQAALKKYGLDLPAVLPRYRTPYFSHIWGGGYAAGYYAYLWSEVLEADAFEWFKEHGGMTRDNGMHYRGTVLSKGGSKDAMQLYLDFRGRAAEVGPLLKKRGLK
ncbi:MAG: M3 family metallopeptidase, partial [Bacteroidetes bacterium]|nr:M3 family metallopeptidase [Bacteroidota bacterium]